MDELNSETGQNIGSDLSQNGQERRRFLKLGGAVLAGAVASQVPLSLSRKAHAENIAHLNPIPDLAPRLTPEVEARVKAATVMIFRDTKGLPRIKPEDWYRDYWGSAFHINGDGTILTNSHVVRAIALDWKTYKEAPIKDQVRMLNEGKFREDMMGISIGHPDAGAIPVELVYTDEECDFAILRYDTTKYIGTRGFASIPIVKGLQPKAGETVYSVGYPAITLNLKGKYEIHQNRGVYLGNKSRRSMIIAQGFDPVEYHPKTSGGSSGSPWVNRNGEVVGISYAAYGNHIGNRDPIANTISDMGFDPTTQKELTTAYAVPIQRFIEHLEA